MASVPDLRIRVLRDLPVRADGEFVLYWMIAFRRRRSNFSLQRAVEWARELRKPLVILEAVRTRYEWASDRLHRFIIEGMQDNAHDLGELRQSGVVYHPYVEPTHGAGAGLLEALAKRAAVVITDDFPCFFLPQMTKVAARKVPVRMETIDGNGILPMRAADKTFTMAFHFRRWLQKNLKPHLAEEAFPEEDPLARVKLPALKKLPAEITERWPAADFKQLLGARGLAQLPIDHSVTPTSEVGGAASAARVLERFLDSRLSRYGERNEPDANAASGLSPWLHFGHVSVHDIARRALARESWSHAKLSAKTDGKAGAWWGVSAACEGFLDELITWREIGFNFCSRNDNFDQYESLPTWVQKTLDKHAVDPRPNLYTLDQFESSTTHDLLWNAAQRQLVREGRIHNYMRMLWGKKILEWSTSPREALRIMIQLNNKYALDGRNPNSYSGIFWILGRYDRPWSPERPIFGNIRYMSSDNTARKLRVKNYLKQFGSDLPAASQKQMF